MAPRVARRYFRRSSWTLDYHRVPFGVDSSKVPTRYKAPYRRNQAHEMCCELCGQRSRGEQGADVDSYIFTRHPVMIMAGVLGLDILALEHRESNVRVL